MEDRFNGLAGSTRVLPIFQGGSYADRVTDPERTALTYRLERWRAVTTGILESAATTFLLLIAVRWFGAGAVSKSFIAAGNSLGYLLTPLVVTYVTRRLLQPSEAAFRLSSVGAVALALPAILPWEPLFVVGSVTGMTLFAAVIPLQTHMYQSNYPAAQRGRLFSRAFMIRIASAAISASLGGALLAGHFERFRWLLAVFAIALATAGLLLRRCPTTLIADAGGGHPLRALRFVREDPLFRRTLIAWMLMGFANLMMLPLRVEYLANRRYGLQLPADQIALYTGVIPNVARLLMSPVWGWLFDRMNFFALRATLNVGFIIGILAFFATHSTSGLAMGAVAYGISTAGGDVAWSLWVTKFSPPDRVADYMSVHTALTGLRGVLAPVTAFQLAGVVSLPALGWVSAALIGASCLLLVREMWMEQRSRQTAPVVEASTDPSTEP